MPLAINVGLSRKASKDFQSTGVSINVTAELDQALLARPGELQQQIGDLYAQARQALDQQVTLLGEPQRLSSSRPAAGPRTGREGDGGLGQGANGNGHIYARNGSPMTASQRQAIASIARAMGVEPAAEAKDLLGVELEELSIRQASELIDHLKSLSPAGRVGR